MRHVVVHGHFYQPPRENPWLDAIDPQPTAAPFHDWNERITAECYRPFGQARVLDEHGRLLRLADNWSRISYDVGPSLMSYLATSAPDVHAAIVQGDRRTHGAMAQGHHHAILPLCSERDRRTEIRWGLHDFSFRYGRRAEGFWLPECAVDPATLAALAEEGVRYVILAPHQAACWRTEGGSWQSAAKTPPDPGRWWRARFGDRELAVLFYDGPLSQAIAFQRALDDGRNLAARIAERARPGRLVVLATDGESYGHHHRFGEMALATALDRLAGLPDLSLGNLPRFLSETPPAGDVEVKVSAWSCAHGVERWRSDCGCRMTGGSQAWRGPLRAALDALRDRVGPRWEEAAAPVFRDPWAARDAYIGVLLDPSTLPAFLQDQAPDIAHLEIPRALGLLELQRDLLRMYTSCGWFFDDIAGIEPSQILLYAARAADRAVELLGDNGAPHALHADLARAHGNLPARPDGLAVLMHALAPSRLGPLEWAADRAIRVLCGVQRPAGHRHRLDIDVENAAPTAVSGQGRVTEPATQRTHAIHWESGFGPDGQPWARVSGEGHLALLEGYDGLCVATRTELDQALAEQFHRELADAAQLFVGRHRTRLAHLDPANLPLGAQEELGDGVAAALEPLFATRSPSNPEATAWVAVARHLGVQVPTERLTQRATEWVTSTAAAWTLGDDAAPERLIAGLAVIRTLRLTVDLTPAHAAWFTRGTSVPDPQRTDLGNALGVRT